MDADLKEQLVERFRHYLDEAGTVDGGESDQESGEVDLYTLFTELTALKSEVKLESRQAKKTLDRSNDLIEELRTNNLLFKEELAHCRREQSRNLEAAERPLLLGILDLRDRIEAGLSSLRKYRLGLLNRRMLKRFLAGIGEGLEISLRRLDGLLERYQVRSLEPVGSRMDPNTMQVTAIEYRNDQDEGIVLDEVRKGFLRDGKVLRLAEVVVNKSKKGSAA